MDLYIPQTMCQHTIIGIIICLHHKLHVLNLYISDYMSICEHTNQSVYTTRQSINYSELSMSIYQKMYIINTYTIQQATHQLQHTRSGIFQLTQDSRKQIFSTSWFHVTESLINIPTRWGTFINLQILEQTCYQRVYTANLQQRTITLNCNIPCSIAHNLHIYINPVYLPHDCTVLQNQAMGQ